MEKDAFYNFFFSGFGFGNILYKKNYYFFLHDDATTTTFIHSITSILIATSHAIYLVSATELLFFIISSDFFNKVIECFIHVDTLFGRCFDESTVKLFSKFSSL